MSWDFSSGVHELTFLFRSGTSGQGGLNQAWIDNLHCHWMAKRTNWTPTTITTVCWMMWT